MREAHVGDVWDEVVADLPVAEEFPVIRPPPAAQMHLVDRRGAVAQVAPRPDPACIGPVMADETLDDRGGGGRGFGAKGDWVGLERQEVTLRPEDLELVERAAGDAGQEDFPNAGLPALAHRVPPPVPGVEVAHDADAPRIRRPDGEGGALGAFVRDRMGAELAVKLLVPALGHQVFVHFAEHRPEAIRDLRAPIPAPCAAQQAIGEGLSPSSEAGMEEAFRVHALELRPDRALRVEEGNLRGIRGEDVHGHRPARDDHSQDPEGIAVLTAQDRLHLVRFRRGRRPRAVAHVRTPSGPSRSARSPSIGTDTQSGRIDSS
jgi:hypothetical protein